MKRFFTIVIGLCLISTTQAASAASTLQERVEARRTARLVTIGTTTPKPQVQRVITTRQSRRSLRDNSLLRREERIKKEERIKTEPVPVVETGNLGELRTAVLTLTNAERAKENLAPLSYNALLEQAAQKHAEDMASRQFFAHENPDGETPRMRIQEAGYAAGIDNGTCHCKSYKIGFGENIAKGQETPEQVVEDWMNSPPHRENILSPYIREIGIGIVGDIWVQNFGLLEIVY